MSESQTDTPVEGQPEAPKVDPERARLEQVIEAERRRAAAAEAQAAYAAGMAQAAAQRQPEAPRVDPLEDYSKNDLTMSPEEKRRALASAIGGAARMAEERAAQKFEQRMAWERANMEQKFALDSVIAAQPELADPRNAGKFGAAITKVKMEAEATGQQLSPMQLAQKAKEEYNTLFRPQGAPRPPFVEGANRPDLTPGMQQQQTQPTPQNQLEKTYGIKPGSIRPLVDPNDNQAMDAFNLEYVRGKNKPLFDKGINSSLENVQATVRD